MNERQARRLVVIGAPPSDELRAGYDEVIHLRQPGGDVAAAVRPGDSYYTVDYAGGGFECFVTAVLRPLKPAAVVAVPVASRAAGVVSDQLGIEQLADIDPGDCRTAAPPAAARPATLILNRRSHQSLFAGQRCLVPLDQVEPYLLTHAYGGVTELDPKQFRHTYVVDVRDEDQIRTACEWLIRDGGVRRIVGLQEKSVLLAARLRTEFGLAGIGYESAVRFRDKVIMKQAAAAAGIQTPRFRAIDSLQDFDDLDWPAERWVLKGRVGEGSSDVHIFDSLEQARQAWQALHPTGVRFELEEFVTGDIYHCDGVRVAGRLVFCASSKYVGRPDEFGPDRFLASYVLPESPLTRRMAAFTDEVLTALGLTDGVCHLELFHTPADSLVLCEVACRPAGGLVPQAIRRSRGVDLTAAAIATDAGIPLELPPNPSGDGSIWGWAGVFSRTGGRVPVQPTEHGRLSVAEHWPGAAGDRPPRHCTDYTDGYVFAADSEEEWLARLDELVAGVGLA